MWTIESLGDCKQIGNSDQINERVVGLIFFGKISISSFIHHFDQISFIFRQRLSISQTPDNFLELFFLKFWKFVEYLHHHVECLDIAFFVKKY